MRTDDQSAEDSPVDSSKVHSHETTVGTDDNVYPWEVDSPPGEDELTSYQTFRHNGWTALRAKVKQAMIDAGHSDKTIYRFCNCGRFVQVESSASTKKVRLVGSFCKCRGCAPCSAARSALISKNLIDFLGDRTTRFLTLTMKHDGESLTCLISRIKKSFKLMRSEAEWKRNVKGFAAFLEVKWSTRKAGWHVHYHILLEGSWWDSRDISRLWHKSTGDSFIVDIQAKGTNASRAFYAAKYASKPFSAGDIPTAALLAEAVNQLHRIRLWIIGGTWKGLKLLAKPTSTIRDWTFLCTASKLFDDARHGDEASRLIIVQLTHADEDRWSLPIDFDTG